MTEFTRDGDGMSADLRLAAWEEWKRKCDYTICGNDNREYLGGLAMAALDCACERIGGGKQLPTTAFSQPELCFQLFETQAINDGFSNGKFYKDHMFMRAMLGPGSIIQELEKRLDSVLARLLARKFARDATAAGGRVFHDAMAIIGGGEASPSRYLKDVRARPSDIAQAHDLAEIAETVATELINSCDLAVRQRYRAVLLAKYLDLPLPTPAVQALAGGAAGRLGDTFRHIRDELIPGLLRRRMPSEDGGVMAILQRLTIEAAKKQAFSWALAEKPHRPPFTGNKKENDPLLEILRFAKRKAIERDEKPLRGL